MTPPRSPTAAAAAAAAPQNIRDIWDASRTWVEGSTTTTKAFSIVLCSSYVLYVLFPSTSLTFALVPDRTLPSVWNLLTAGYFELSLVSVAFDTVALMLLGRKVEPIWGAAEFIKFVMVVNVCIGTFAFCVMYLLYVLTLDSFYLYAEFGGFHGVIAALLVAVRQLSPEEPLIDFGPARLQLRAKHYLGAYVVSTLLWCIMSGGQHHHIGLYVFVLAGAYAGWLYLRYFQVTPSGVGDRSPEFAFHMLFPEQLRPLARRVSQSFHSLFCEAVSSPTHTVTSLPVTPAQIVQGAGRVQAAAVAAAAVDPRRRELGERGARLLEERLSIRPPTATPDGMVDIMLSPSGKQRTCQASDAAV